jgi:hypothetical protein
VKNCWLPAGVPKAGLVSFIIIRTITTGSRMEIETNMNHEAYLIVGWTIVAIASISNVVAIIFLIRNRRAERERDAERNASGTSFKTEEKT